MKTRFLLVLFLFTSLIGQGQNIKWWYYDSNHDVKYIDYNQINYVVSGITYKWYLLNIPVEVLDTTYARYMNGAWTNGYETGWRAQFGSSYLFEQRGDMGVGTVWMLAYDTYTQYYGYTLFIKVAVNDSLLDAYYSEYEAGITYDTVDVPNVVTIYDTVPLYVYDTLPVYDTIPVSITDTVVIYDTIYNTITRYDTLWNYNTITEYDTFWVYDTSWTYNTITEYDTTYITVEDTLHITLDVTGNAAYDAIDLRVYPNPARDELHVNYSPDILQNSIFGIFDSNGKEVVWGYLNDSFSTLDISGLSAGVYTICIYNGDVIYSSKTLIITD